jgi:hypothetical protein
MKKDVSENVKPQMERYKEEGFPTDYGLLQSNIIIRKHNEPDCVRLMEAWSEEVMNGSHRDQLSFNYCCWKNKDIKIKYLDKFIYRSKWFSWNSAHSKRKSQQVKPGTYNSASEKKARLKNVISTARSARLAKLKTNNIRIY